ncbi:MAG TPA: bifunctional (p)ppGpp synthetase/guanosine-3',5'-bis(diphosphate) 3'-pyrophosphohydrolase [Ramlibacter sp.]|nr:bifunctional (p)ppGpp synthetase/guanosine-3',5'-bis(diphosphate) 3'-pyrophosphohydrolase [Ramlibacter sp.]
MTQLEDTLGTLAELGADRDVITAAVLSGAPHLLPAAAPMLSREAPAVATLLESLQAAEQVWQLHQARQPASARSAEGLRRLLLAIVRDLRVLPLLLAQHLARLRLSARLTPPQRAALAGLARDIHAPLANRLGIWQLKWELEDRAFRILEPQTYQRIAATLDETRRAREHFVADVCARLREALATQSITADVAGRPKHITSIWKKMQRKAVSIEQLHDLRAVRVLVEDVAACYAALGVAHALWAPVPGEFDDYIARPKPNDYRSLHTAVVGPEGKTVEVQIRTHEMHRLAELGMAAHWRYKEGSQNDAGLDRRIAWMRRLLDAHRDEPALADALDAELAEQRIYALTPKGDVVDLPPGATPLDFAYHVHTEVGHRCRGAKVNGRIVPLDHVLQSGDRVEVLTAKTGEPRRDWLVASNGFLASSRSREKVRAWFHRLDRARNARAGRELLERELRRMAALHLPLEAALQRVGCASVEELHVAVGLGDVGAHQVARALLEHERGPSAAKSPAPAPVVQHRTRTPHGGVTVLGVAGLLMQVARCCQPLPGEEIVGYLTRSRGVSVHRPDCRAFLRLSLDQPQRRLAVEWGSGSAAHEVDVLLRALDRKWLLKDVTNVIAQQQAHVAAVRSEQAGRGGSGVSLRLRLRVGDFGQLSGLLGRLEALPGVESARRA